MLSPRALRSNTAAPKLARWIREKVVAPLLVGPDEESHQRIAPIAAESGCPSVTLRKRRLGDTQVEIAIDVHDLLADAARRHLSADGAHIAVGSW